MRIRRVPPRQPKADDNDSPSVAGASAVRGAPPSAHYYRGRVRAIISACFIGVLLVLTSSQRSKQRRLPLTYAVCSRENEGIYTVDDSLPNVPCIVISDDVIADRGPLNEIRRHWGDKDTTGPAIEPLSPDVPKSGTKIYFLGAGEALYPGFADAHAHILSQYLSILDAALRAFELFTSRLWPIATVATLWIPFCRRYGQGPIAIQQL